MQRMNVIALMGPSKSGKDTSGKILAEMGNGATLAFADKLKSIVGEMFNLTHKDLYDEAFKEAPTSLDCLLCPECKKPEVTMVSMEDGPLQAECGVCGTVGDARVFKGKWTPRTILQYLGTEGFRKIDPSVWVRYALAKADAALKANGGDKDYIVITDCRFKSEMEAVLAAGGEVWRIKRPEVADSKAGLKGHASEQEMNSIPDSHLQAIIDNDSTIEVLHGRLAAQFNRFQGERREP